MDFTNEILIKVATPKSGSEFYDKFIIELQFELNKDGRVFVALNNDSRSPISALPYVNEIIVALGSAGAFSVLYQIISSYLARNDKREITIEKDDNIITIKGHSLPEEKELLNLFTANFQVKPTITPTIKKSKGKKKDST